MLISRRRGKGAWAGVWILLLASSSAVAKPWYITADTSSEANPNNNFYTFNDNAGPASLVGQVAAADQTRILGIDSLTGGGTLYAVTSFGSGANDNSLLAINPANGTANVIGTTGLSSLIEGDIGFDPTSGILYGLFTVGSLPSLYTINTSTGSATLAANIDTPFTGFGNRGDPSGLAFDQTGQLWVLSRSGGGAGFWHLLQVDKTDGSVSADFTTTVTASGIDTVGLDFDSDGNLFAAFDNGNFYSVDTSNGVVAIVAEHEVTATGLALVPEPSTWALVLTLPLFAAAWLLWRRTLTSSATRKILSLIARIPEIHQTIRTKES